MDIPRADHTQARAPLRPPLLWGVAFGWIHAATAGVELAVWDVRLNLADMLIWMVAYGLIGATFGAVWWLACGMFRGPAAADATAGIESSRSAALFLSAALIHSGIGASIVFERVGGPACAAAAVVGAGLALSLYFARPRDAWTAAVWIAASTIVTFVNQAVAAVAQMRIDVPATNDLAWIGLIHAGVIALLILWFALSGRTASPSSPRADSAVAPARRSSAIAIPFGGLPLLTAATVIHASAITPSFDWHVARPEPTRRGDPGDARPNVLLIVLDTVRADRMSLFGAERDTTPGLARFAHEQADDARTILSTAPSTLPTHASMFTGQYAHVHGAHQPFLIHEGPRPRYGYPLRADLPTLAEKLGDLGYRTGGIAANYGVLGGYGLSRGFEEWDVAPGPAFRGVQLDWLSARTIGGNALGHVLRESLPPAVGEASVLFNAWAPPYRDAAEIAQRTLNWIGRADPRPFFLLVNVFDAHDPYVAPAPWRRRFAQPDAQFDYHGFVPEPLFQQVMRGDAPLPERDAGRLADLYDAELAWLDRHVSNMLNTFTRSAEFDNTLIVITSDHGDSLGEHGLLRHGTCVYDHQVRVPLIVRFPKSLPVRPVIADHFQFVDVMPSVLDIIGATPPAGIAGVPWGWGRDFALSEVFVHEPDIPRLKRELCAVQVGSQKMIVSTTGTEEYFDLAKDPRESHPSGAPSSEWLAQVRSVVRRRNEQLVRALTTGKEDRALTQKLKSLGYLN